MLGGVAGVRAALGVGPAARRPGRRDRGAADGRRRRLRQLPRRGDRPPRVRQARRGAGPRARATRRSTSSPGAPPTTRTGYFVRPTIVGRQPTPPTTCSRTEYFGPILAVHVYDDGDFDQVLAPGRPRRALRADRLGDRPRPRGRSRRASEALRFAAGNFYVNDKPTGAVVGQQPFGGGRASRHQRQGRLDPQPAALDEPAHDQGDLRAADQRRRYPAPGLTASGRARWPAPSPRPPRRAWPASRPASPARSTPGSRGAPSAGTRPSAPRAGGCGGERGGEVVGHDEVLDVVEQRPRPVGLGRARSPPARRAP